MARKFASIRAFYRHLVERGELAQNPADLVSHGRRRSPLPKLLRTDELTALLDRIPARTPLETRDRAMLELDLLVRPALRGGREPRRTATSTSTPRSCA